MNMKFQEISIHVGKFNAVGKTSDDRPGQLSDRRSDSPTPQKQQAGKTSRDQEYARSMEERYGIREEGVF